MAAHAARHVEEEEAEAAAAAAAGTPQVMAPVTELLAAGLLARTWKDACDDMIFFNIDHKFAW